MASLACYQIKTVALCKAYKTSPILNNYSYVTVSILNNHDSFVWKRRVSIFFLISSKIIYHKFDNSSLRLVTSK